jgi:hypothetical protein
LEEEEEPPDPAADELDELSGDEPPEPEVDELDEFRDDDPPTMELPPAEPLLLLDKDPPDPAAEFWLENPPPLPFPPLPPDVVDEVCEDAVQAQAKVKARKGTRRETGCCIPRSLHG